ncbi:hypothetical protein EON80_09425 [bacterium]|nr:MAG: hypothetical protein EON80_09425 [bacterium]
MKRFPFKVQLSVTSILVPVMGWGMMLSAPLPARAQAVASGKIAAPNSDDALDPANYAEMLASPKYEKSGSAALTTYALKPPAVARQADSVDLMSVFLEELSDANLTEMNGTSKILVSHLSEKSKQNLSRLYRYCIGNSRDPISAKNRELVSKVIGSQQGSLWIYVKPRLAILAEAGKPLGEIETETGKFRAAGDARTFHMEKPAKPAGFNPEVPDVTVPLESKTYSVSDLETLFSTPQTTIVADHPKLRKTKIFLTAGDWKLSELLQALNGAAAIDWETSPGTIELAHVGYTASSKQYEAMKKKVEPAIDVTLSAFKGSIEGEKFQSRSKAFQKLFSGDLTERIAITSPDFPPGLPIDYNQTGTYAQPMLELFFAPSESGEYDRSFLSSIDIIRPQ